MAIRSITQANQVFNSFFNPSVSSLVSASGHALGSFPHYRYILQTPTEITLIHIQL